MKLNPKFQWTEIHLGMLKIVNEEKKIPRYFEMKKWIEAIYYSAYRKGAHEALKEVLSAKYTDSEAIGIAGELVNEILQHDPLHEEKPQ